MAELSKSTWPEAAELFGAGVVVLVPLGSTEPHGPHLPLDTDVTIAVAQAQRAAERLGAEGVTTALLPAMPYGLTRFTEGFAGTISLRPGTLWAFLEDVVESLGAQGVRHVVFVNGHLEPEHVQVIRGVAADSPGRVVFPDNTRRKWAQTLGDEFAGGDCHAGRYESSIVLAADPDAVRDDERAALAPLAIGLIDKMKAGAKNFRECGAERAYCGDPAAATPVEGTELIDRLATIVVETVRETWPELFA